MRAVEGAVAIASQKGGRYTREAMITLLSTLTLLSSAHADGGSAVLLPEFSAGTLADFGAAEQVTAQVEESLRARGLSVDGPAILVAQHPDLAVGCAEIPGCPTALLARTDGRIAIVGALRRSDGGQGYTATVYFFTPGEILPTEELVQSLTVDGIKPLAADIADVAEQLLPLVPPRSSPPPPPPPPSPPILPPMEEEPPLPVSVRVQEGPSEAELNDPRLQALPEQARRRFVASGQTLEDWLLSARVRSGHVFLEIGGGGAYGDVWRRYDTRIALLPAGDGSDSLAQSLAYEYEAFVQGPGGSAGITLGYAPTWWIQLDLYGGVLFSAKELSTGWEHIEEGSLVEEDSVVYDPARAGMGVLEPRARLLLVATGPVKPYALLGAHLRAYDGYQVPDLTTVDYADRPGGLGVGLGAGGGVAFDSASSLTGFIEIPWTYLLAPRPYLQEGEDLLSTPVQAPGSRQVFQLRAGLGIKL